MNHYAISRLHPSVMDAPYFDDARSLTVSTTVTTDSLLYALANAGGLLQQFPAHASPVYAFGAFQLRQRIWLYHMELRIEVVGSAANAVAPGDVFNTFRIAVYRVGETFQSTSLSYLKATTTGTNLSDVQHVYLDLQDRVVTQAIYPTSSFNVPGVKTYAFTIPLNFATSFYSNNASGSGVAWENRERDLMIDYVSDSGVTPNPTVSVSARIFFEYSDRPRTRKRD